MYTVYPATTFDSTITYPSVLYPAPQYTTGTTQEQLDGQAFFTSNALLHLPDWSNGAGRPGILACHGRQQTAWSSFAPGDSRWGDYTRALVDGGFVMLAIDLGANSWSNNLTLRLLDQAYTYLTGITGGTKVGLMGSSMGTICALQWLRRNRTKVAGTWLSSAFTDLDTVRGTAGWTTPYAVLPGDPNGDIVYGGDPTLAAAQAASLNGAYKATNDAQWSANAIIQMHTPSRYPEDWRGSRIHFAHAYRDATSPYQANKWWVEQCADPLITIRYITASTAGHEPESHLAGQTTDAATLAAGGLARYELVDFFREAFL